MSFTNSLLHSVYNNWLPDDVKPSWHLVFLLGNQVCDSFKGTILCIGCLSICSPSFWVFPSNNVTVRTKSSESVFVPPTFAIGHWFRLASVFSRTTPPFWEFLCLLFHLGRDWSEHTNLFRHLTQNSLAICCTHLRLFLLHSSASQNKQVVAKLSWTTWWECYLGVLVVCFVYLPTYLPSKA